MHNLLFFFLFTFSFSIHAKCSDCSHNKNIKTYSDSNLIKTQIAEEASKIVVEAMKGNLAIKDSKCKKLNIIDRENFYTFEVGQKQSYILLEETSINNEIYSPSLCTKKIQEGITTINCVTRSRKAFENMNQDGKLSFTIKYGKIKREEGGVIDALIECPTSG